MKNVLIIFILSSVLFSAGFDKWGTQDFYVQKYDRTTNGEALTGVSVKEYGDAFYHKTVLTISADFDSVTADTQALGLSLYTLPDGAIVIKAAKMDIAITGTDSVTSDTPDGGLGMETASGTHSALSDTAAFESIITGQTFNDVDGTAEVKTIAASDVVVESADTERTVNFNIADIWAGNDIISASGTVVLFWYKVDE